MVLNAFSHHRFWKVVLMAGLIAAGGSSPASAIEVEPLRSTELDAQLKAAGFDDAQRARVLADHAGYVERFAAVAAERLAEWQAAGRMYPSTIEEARAYQSKSRSAANAIDEAERPLLDAVRAAARPDQEAGVRRAITLLEIRRDLTFANAMPVGFFSSRNLDAFDAVNGLKLPDELAASIQPQLDQYLAERQVAVRRIREATINLPLRRTEATLNHPAPTPIAGGADGDLQRWRREVEARHNAVRIEGEAEWTTARVKAVELDLRTLDAVRARLNGRQQVQLIKIWWDGHRAFASHEIGNGPGALKRAWEPPSDRVAADLALRLDAICVEWIGGWWPTAKERILKRVGSREMFLVDLPSDREGQTDLQRAIAATTRAHEAIDFAFDGKVAAPKGPEGSAVTRDGDVQTLHAEVATVVVGEAVSGPIELVLGEALSAGGVFEFEGGAGGITFAVTDDTGMSIAGAGVLPRMMQFDEIQPSLVAAGVEPAMMDVAQTVLDDLVTEASGIVKESEAAQAAKIAKFQSGAVTTWDAAAEMRDAAETAGFRARLLALELAKIEELIAAVVPAAGVPCISWIAPWRQFVSERSAELSGGVMFGVDQQSLDPTLAVRATKLSGSEWCMLGPEFTTVCASLAAAAHESVAASERSRAAMAKAFTSSEAQGGGVGGGVVEFTQSDQDEFMRTEREEQRAKKALRDASLASIKTLKNRLGPESAQRLQDVWDDQLYASDLNDPTSLTSRFEQALLLTLSDEVKARVVALQSSWVAAARSARDKIVAVKSQPLQGPKAAEGVVPSGPEATERRVQVKAIRFERDELNRRVFRELCTALGADLASTLKPLPEGKKRGGTAIGGAVLTPASTTAP